MKHICIEGGDRLGKDTIIKSLCEHYDYKNVTIRHFDKPPKGLTPKESLDFQFEVFYKEMLFANHLENFIEGDEWGYHENILIWNRSHLGEYVYSQMFRGIGKKDVAFKIKLYEERNIKENQFLITLTADPKFFLEQEDGLSLSKDIEDKSKELLLFKEAHAISLIRNKKLIKVNKGNKYRPKEEIFDEVLNLIRPNEKQKIKRTLSNSITN